MSVKFPGIWFFELSYEAKFANLFKKCRDERILESMDTIGYRPIFDTKKFFPDSDTGLGTKTFFLEFGYQKSFSRLRVG